jgi:hypothetical protein
MNCLWFMGVVAHPFDVVTVRISCQEFTYVVPKRFSVNI